MLENKKKRKLPKKTILISAILLTLGSGGLFIGTGDSFNNNLGDGSTQIESPENTISIEVKSDIYIIDGTECSITKVESLIIDSSNSDANFVVVDNYGSAKAWDELSLLFTKHSVSYTEQ